MSADRELLEAAAKAEGHAYPWVLSAGFGERPWNPLTDDGDALRLAVALGIDITFKAFGDDEVMTSDSGDSFDGWFTEAYANDRAAATRRAITRAAAAIGGTP